MAKKKLLIAAVIVGAFAALLIYLYSQQQEERIKTFTADQVEVIHAARDIPEGTPLSADNVTTRKIPQSNLHPSAIRKEALSGYIDVPVARNIPANTMILDTDLMSERSSNTLATRIPPGERAMSVPVDAISGISGLLRPGDQIDILGTFPVGSRDQLVEEAGGGSSIGYMTITLLHSVTLLAVGEEISGVGTDPSTARGGYSTVTVSVTINEAELLTIAQTRGELMMLLRHPEDTEIGSVKRTTLRTVLEDLEVINRNREVRTQKRKAPARKPKDDGIQIYRGTDSGR